MAYAQKFEDLEVWKRARKLTKEIYEATNSGEFARDFGLKDQIRRASVSIMSKLPKDLIEATKVIFSNSYLLPEPPAVKFSRNSMSH